MLYQLSYRLVYAASGSRYGVSLYAMISRPSTLFYVFFYPSELTFTGSPDADNSGKRVAAQHGFITTRTNGNQDDGHSGPGFNLLNVIDRLLRQFIEAFDFVD